MNTIPSERTAQANLSPIAEAILDGYYTLCSGGETIEYVISDYLSRTPDSGMLPWGIDGETPVSPLEFLSAIEELIVWFRNKGEVL
ncbi:MAG: hypothetical protein JW384_03819 [Nitrosomonadaceae bacterium]|nr:hypothetical protein [Nitrosomonadaceae bacterium]